MEHGGDDARGRRPAKEPREAEDSTMSDDGLHCGDGPADEDAYRMSERAPTSVEELMRLDAEDESLRRYKERLLGSAAHGDVGDRSDTRRVVVEAFKVVFEDGRQEINYHLDTPQGVEYMKSTPFVMDEGVRYRFVIRFRVNQAIVSGLRFRNKVKKTVLSTTDEIVLGSYAPRSEAYEFEFPRNDWMDAPSGMFYRGRYMAQFRFTDDDGQEHLKVFYTFEIKKA
ncbi:hypothetical protein ATCC90586_002584 [Pythium insidiosum]|nr:hypothetical protein ATCC90586_002584 [Pythium insidiosum]